MLQRAGVRLAKWLLNSGTLSIEDSVSLTTVLLDKLGALPYKDIIYVDEQGRLIVQGQPVNIDEAKALYSSALVALNNKALKYIFEQTKFTAVNHGLNKAETVEQVYFGRTALWAIQNIQKSLEILSGKEDGGII